MKPLCLQLFFIIPCPLPLRQESGAGTWDIDQLLFQNQVSVTVDSQGAKGKAWVSSYWMAYQGHIIAHPLRYHRRARNNLSSQVKMG